MALHDNTQEMDTLLKKTQLLGAEWQKFTAAIGKAGALEDLKSFADNIRSLLGTLASASSYIYSPLKSGVGTLAGSMLCGMLRGRYSHGNFPTAFLERTGDLSRHFDEGLYSRLIEKALEFKLSKAGLMPEGLTGRSFRGNLLPMEAAFEYSQFQGTIGGRPAAEMRRLMANDIRTLLSGSGYMSQAAYDRFSAIPGLHISPMIVPSDEKALAEAGYAVTQAVRDADITATRERWAALSVKDRKLALKRMAQAEGYKVRDVEGGETFGAARARYRTWRDTKFQTTSPYGYLVTQPSEPSEPIGFYGKTSAFIQRHRGVTAMGPVSYTHLRAHETVLDLVCRLLLEKKNKTTHLPRRTVNEPLYLKSSIQLSLSLLYNICIITYMTQYQVSTVLKQT